jgi:queuosine precursor transporter
MNTAPTAVRRHDYHLYDVFVGAFVAVLILTNLVGVGKVISLGPLTFGASALFFPISYVFGDILTEVYGYSYARRAVWTAFGALIFMSIMTFIVVRLPPAPSWKGQAAYEEIFNQTPRIVLASMIAFWSGEFVNAYVMAKFKLLTRGRYLWSRIIGSTVVGQAVDSILFFPLAFLGVWPISLVITVTITNYLLKVAWEVVCTPLTYAVIAKLKQIEQEDYVDEHTDFSPFRRRL